MIPVSYTHLDVYKRQLLRDAGEREEYICPLKRERALL